MSGHPNYLLFDGDCAFCQFSVRILRRLDWFHRLNYVSARDADSPVVRDVPVAKERLLEEMHVWPSAGSTTYHGFGAFRWMAWRLPAFWLLAPFLYLPLVPWLGQKVYMWVARNRFKLVPCRDGVCDIQRGNANSATNSPDVSSTKG